VYTILRGQTVPAKEHIRLTVRSTFSLLGVPSVKGILGKKYQNSRESKYRTTNLECWGGKEDVKYVSQVGRRKKKKKTTQHLSYEHQPRRASVMGNSYLAGQEGS